MVCFHVRKLLINQEKTHETKDYFGNHWGIITFLHTSNSSLKIYS